MSQPGTQQLRLRVHSCGVCHTDLHVVEGELPHPELPVVPGHQVVAVMDALGDGGAGWKIGDRVGVPSLSHTCGSCSFCRGGQENLCQSARFTGYHVDGGYAEYALVDVDFAVRITPVHSLIWPSRRCCARG